MGRSALSCAIVRAARQPPLHIFPRRHHSSTRTARSGRGPACRSSVAISAVEPRDLLSITPGIRAAGQGLCPPFSNWAAVDFEVLGQPYRDWPSGESFLSTALMDPGVTRLLVLTAWVRESGMKALAPGLEELEKRGGDSQIVVGVDLQGTTRQGLELARKLIKRVHVAHDPAGRTFHPKLYLALGVDRGYALLGSHNVTAAGLSFNYEGSLACVFDPKREPDLARGIDAYAAAILKDRAICRRVTDAVFARLVAEKWLADEDSDRRHRNEDRTRKPPSPQGGGDPLFSPSDVEKRTRTPPRGGPPARRSTSKGTRARMAVAPDTWWKQLGKGEAQRLEEGHLTGVIRLTAPAGRSDRPTFFRRVFFAEEKWRSTRDANGNHIEVAEARFDVELGGRALGRFELRLNYGSYRNVRGRATTVLHLGSLASELLRVDVTGWFLLIERGARVHRLVITPNQPA
jgi:hypothetical protein